LLMPFVVALHTSAEGPPLVLPPPLPRQAQHVAVGVELPDVPLLGRIWNMEREIFPPNKSHDTAQGTNHIFSMMTRVDRKEGHNEGGQIDPSLYFFLLKNVGSSKILFSNLRFDKKILSARFSKISCHEA